MISLLKRIQRNWLQGIQTRWNGMYKSH